jgi:hypothetical protein
MRFLHKSAAMNEYKYKANRWPIIDPVITFHKDRIDVKKLATVTVNRILTNKLSCVLLCLYLPDTNDSASKECTTIDRVVTIDLKANSLNCPTKTEIIEITADKIKPPTIAYKKYFFSGLDSGLSSIIVFWFIDLCC